VAVTVRVAACRTFFFFNLVAVKEGGAVLLYTWSYAEYGRLRLADTAFCVFLFLLSGRDRGGGLVHVGLRRVWKAWS
jgi:hypothetical protein